MRKAMLWSAAHPAIVLGVVALCSLLAALRVGDLRIDTSIEGMMVQSGPAMGRYEAAMEKFGSDRIAVIFLKDDELFTPGKLRALEQMISDLERVDDIETVESLFSVNNFKNVDGSLNSGPLLDWVPETVEQAEVVRKDAIRNPVLVGNLVSADGTATAVNLYLTDASGRPNFMATVSKQIDEVITPYTSAFDTIFQTGQPYNIWSQEKMIAGDQTLLVPLSTLVLLLTLVMTMRSASGAILPIITAGTSLLWTIGFMAWFDFPMTALTSIVPSLLIVIGSTEDIHILSTYMEGLHEEKGVKQRALEFMAAKVGTAVTLTSLTTFLGFLSISLTDVTMMREFGFVAAFALAANPVATFLLAPIYLRFFGPAPRAAVAGDAVLARFFHRLADGIVAIIRAYRWIVLGGMLAVGVVAALLCFRLEVDNNPQLFFKKGSPVLEQVKTLRESMAGAWTLFITVDTDQPGAFKQPENLALVEEFTQFMDEQGWFDKTITLSDYIKLLHREMNGGDDRFYAVPPRAESIAEYLLFLHRHDVQKFVTPEFDDLNILVRHNVPSSHEMLEILDVLEAKAAEIFPPALRVDFTGTTVLVNRSAHAIANGQIQGIAFITVVIFTIMSILFMQVKAGLLSLLPNLMPVAALFGAMVIFGIPLDVGTAMIAVIAIGIAVDDTIHFMTHYQKSMRELQDQDAAMEATVRSELQPIVSTSFALSLGFGVLAVSEFVPVVNFGVLAALVMVVALLADLFMTPILLSSTQLITLWDMVSLRVQKEALARSRVFAGMRTTQIKTIVLLGRLVERAPGEAIVRAGEPGKSLFVVLDGEARVSVQDARAPKDFEVARLGPGDIFGEMALVEPGPRTAGVEAVTALRCLEIDWNGLERIRRYYPRIAGKLFLNLSRVIGARLKQTDQMLMQARGALQLQVERRRAE